MSKQKNIWFDQDLPEKVKKCYPGDNDYEKYIKYVNFWKLEKSRCKDGFFLADGTVHIHPWLYFHTTYHKAEIDDFTGIIKGKIKATPRFRDIEWEIQDVERRCRKEQKGVSIFGSRGGGKTIWVTSMSNWITLFFKGQEVILSAGDVNTLAQLTSYCETGLAELVPEFRRERYENKWSSEVRFGKRLPSGEKHPESWDSRFIMRNFDGGKKYDACNSRRAIFHSFDEQGKLPNLIKCYQESMACWSNDSGQFGLPLLTGCVCKGTKVWNNKGELVNIENLLQSDGILGFDIANNLLSKENITYWQEPIEKPCYRITTNTSRTLECSEDHPILHRSRTKRGKLIRPKKYNMTKPYKKRLPDRKIYFEEVKNLRIGDQISIIESVDIFGEEQMWEPRLIGWLIGDGSYGFDSTPVLSNCDADINDYVYKNFNAVLEKTYLTKDKKVYMETRIKGICHKLRELGIYGQTRNKKRLPINIDSYCKEDICELIGGFFDTDGCIHTSVKTNNHVATLTSSSFELLNQVKYLLQKLGIHTLIKESKARVKEGRKDKNNWFVLSVNDRKSLLAFHKNIPLVVKYKQEKLDQVIKNLTPRKNLIPKETSNLRFERIISIEYLGIQLVYNLTADTTHTYIANGIVTHNTGGNFDKGQDAIEMFNEPDLYNLLAFDDVYENSGHKIGYFLPVTKTRNEYKEEWTLYKYLKEKTKIKVTRHPDLLRIKILVSNEEKCMEEWVTPRRNAALESKNMNAIIAEKAKYPILPSECSLRLTGNDFPIEMLKQQKAHLIATGYRGTPVELYRNINTGGVEVNLVTEKKPIANFPIKESDDKTGCVVIYDFPEGKPPWGLHIAGIDPYKQDQAKYSSSLGACYIYRRTHDLYGTGLKDHIVAQYVGRPEDINEFNEQCLLLIEYYNALANSENEDAGFIQYVIQKEKTYLLAQGLDFLREMVPKTTIKRSYGLPGTEKPKSECRNVLINYCKEKIDNIFDDEGNITGAVYGVTRIYDLMLIEEMISYYKGGNFDRIIAASYGMAYARLYMDNHVGAIKEQADDVNMKMYNNFVSNTKKQSFFSSRKKLSFFNRK